MPPPARDTAARIADTRARLEGDVDCWVSTADEAGVPHLVPLSFLWTDGRILVSTAERSATARNLRRGGHARVALGHTRDVVMVDVVVETIELAELSQELGDRFATKTEFDPRTLDSPYVYFGLRPERIQAWREVNELAGRDLMRDGTWLGTPAS